MELARRNFSARALALALPLVGLAAGAARCEPGRYAALLALAKGLPSSKPAAAGFRADAGVLPSELAECRFQPSQMEAVELIVSLIDRYLGPGGKGRSALLAEIRKELPDMKRSERIKLSFGLRFFPGTTRSRLVEQSCRLLLRRAFDSGLAPERLRSVIESAKPA
ncbi:MAG: hypothetical protein KGK30_10115, partial [Elusimicrobia bacterium]|nr:hypothetical protein [Elusimicrobiota bacterium]